MPALENGDGSLDMRVLYSRGGKKNGYHGIGADIDHSTGWDDDDSDEGEVFMQGSRLDRSSASKPLMFPRARAKTHVGHGPCARCRPIVNAVCCFFFLVLSLGSLMGLVVYFVNKHNHKINSTLTTIEPGPVLPDIKQTSAFEFIKQHKMPDFSDVIGCDNVKVEDVWTMGFPKLLTESAFRPLDVNGDGVLDVILGFATGSDGIKVPGIVCDIYFDGRYPCFGGLLALEGGTGREIWRHYTDHELYGLNCEADLDQDDVHDCLAGGRAGAFEAVSGRTGERIWTFGKQEAKNEIMNLYTAQLIPDMDEDGVVDILAIHGGDPLQEPGSEYRLSGRILLMSGRTGHVLQWLGVPDGRESYYSPQVYTWPDGSRLVLFGTGGETHGGSLWVIKLNDLIRGDIKKARALYTDKFKGVMTPPVLADVTQDGVEDIILPMFNSSVLAIDGLDFHIIWNYTFPMSESYHTPSPGYYNDDDVPDFLVKNARGPGFPVYYYSQTTVLDGRTGRPLVLPAMQDAVGAQASGLTVSMEGRGNDLFLYWAADCLKHEGQGGQYRFIEGTNVHEQSRSDFCRLRFKTKGYSKIFAISSNIRPPGTTVYYSEERKAVEHDSWQNTTQMGIDFVLAHPEYLPEYRKFTLLDADEEPEEDDIDNLQDLMTNEGTESLFETPVLDDSERTTYKKGPSRPVYNPDYRKPRPFGFEDLDYESPYNSDPYNDITEEELEPRRRGPELGSRGRKPLQEYGDYFQTTQRTPNYGQFGRGHPTGRRKTSGRYASLVRNEGEVKPIAMRDTSDMFNRDIYTNNRQRRKTDSVQGKTSFKGHSRKNNKRKGRVRKRRHVGPHDEDGLQRLLSTGSLMPTSLPVEHPNYNNSIDFVFATYWFFPAKTRAILPEDQKCIEKKMSEETIRFDPKSLYYGMDHDAYEHAITDECVTEGHHDLPDGGTFESQTRYNPFNIHMGQMTVYRVRLTCTCSNMSSLARSGRRCGRVLPFPRQQWTGYMGNHANSHWKPRHGD
ncbi:uncharacterized protein LOC128233645 [Mya arenaria]|nr:uncharacterized protein LOC128233645 [Mya arenaria]